MAEITYQGMSHMFEKLTSPYRYAPARIRKAQIDALLDQRAVAEFQGSGQNKLKSTDLVTFTADGKIVDQITVQGATISTTRFVIEFNKKVRELEQS